MKSALPRVFSSLALIAVVALPVSARAFHPLLDDPDTVPWGDVYAELEGKFDRDRDASNGELAFALTTGIVRNFDFSCRVPYVGSTEDDRSADGLGDVDIEVKWRFLERGGRRPGLALAASVKLPSADENRGLGSGETDWTVALYGLQGVGPVALYGSVGFTLVGDPSGTELDDVFFLSASAEYPVAESLSLVGSLSFETAAWPTENDALSLFAGSVWRLTPLFAIDGGLQLGLSEGAPDWGVQAGVSLVLQ